MLIKSTYACIIYEFKTFIEKSTIGYPWTRHDNDMMSMLGNAYSKTFFSTIPPLASIRILGLVALIHLEVYANSWDNKY